MTIPSINQYTDSIVYSTGMFRTLDHPECERDRYGNPIVLAGGSAAVFKVRIADRSFALRCFTRPDLQARKIYRHIASHPSELLVPAIYLPEELYVSLNSSEGAYQDVVLTDWYPISLEYEILKALHRRSGERLSVLAHAFDRFAFALLGQEWAHGDIKPENIVVIPGEDRMMLIDYETMYIPDVSEAPSGKLGTPLYQHPLRDEKMTGKQIDDYSLALLSVTLHALAGSAELREYCASRAEISLFTPSEIVTGKSAILDTARRLFIRRGELVCSVMASLLASSTPALDGLTDLFSSLAVPDCPDVRLSLFEERGRWGYRNEQGKTVIPPLFERALEFSEGIAAVTVDGENRYIDPRGHTVLDASRYNHIKSFSCGIAAVREGNMWMYIDRHGYPISDKRYRQASTARNGMVRICDTQGDTREIPVSELLQNSTRTCIPQE